MDQIKCEYSELVNIQDLVPNPKNPNKHPNKQISLLAGIIRFQGMRSPIVVSKRSGFVIKGHGRLEALKKLGWQQAPVDYQDYDDEAQEHADMVADNAIAKWSTQDYSKVNNLLIDLGPDFDVDLMGIRNFSIDPIDNNEIDDSTKEEKDTHKTVSCERCGHQFKIKK